MRVIMMDKEEEEGGMIGVHFNIFILMPVKFPSWCKFHFDIISVRQCGVRGGDVQVKLQGDGRLDISGPAVTVFKGCINL